MPNTVNLEFAGDASKLKKAGGDSQQALEKVGTSANSAASDFTSASKESDDFTTRVGKLGAAVDGASTAIGDAGAAVGALSDLQQAGRERAMRLARAQADVEQAMIDGKQATVDLRQAQEDLNQSELDGKQAAIDVEQAEIDARQAKLDATTAQKAYNDAVKKYGAGSAEAAQAQIDLTQATSDLSQARLDEEQATADARQAQIDATQATTDASQAVRDGKDAQLDLNDAMAEANPTGLQKWADHIQMVTPLLSGIVGVMGLVTAAQWAWNAAQLASPTTWIIAGIVALVAIIVLIATKTDWFQRAWRTNWGAVTSAARGTWNFIRSMGNAIGSTFSKMANAVYAPFRWAFNMIASAWNNTIGRLSWSVPGWIPGIGGNSISVPQIPRFHSGGVVPGVPGSEMLAILQAGEKVTPAAGGGGGTVAIPRDALIDGNRLVEILSKEIYRLGGNVQFVLGTRGA